MTYRPAAPGRLRVFPLLSAWLVSAAVLLAANPFSTAIASPPSPASAPSASSMPPARATDCATTREIAFFSPALGREVRYIALLPSVLEPERRYPVVYLLHGAWGNYRNWTEQAPLARIHAGRPLIIITPDGGQFGWYLDSALIANSRYETFITVDLIADVDKRFPTLARREGRAIAGLSMGGHGALSLAAKHPDLFASASSMSGILRLTNHPGKWQLNKTLGVLPDALPEWRRHNVYDLADRFTTAAVTLLFDCGSSDTATGAIVDNRQFHERLANRGIVHLWREYPGNHNWAYWGGHVGEHLAFHESAFAAWAAGTPPKTGRVIQDQWHQRYVDRALLFERENEERWQRTGAPRPIVLLGSSSFEIYKRHPDLLARHPIANRGITSDRVNFRGERGVIHRLYCSAFDCNPRAVFFVIGRNDLGSTMRTGSPSVEKVAEDYGRVVELLRRGLPDTDIFVISDFPTRDSYARMAPLLPPYNALLKKIAAAHGPRVHYLDVYPELADPEGLLKAEYSSDGLHLNRAGCELLARRIEVSIDRLGVAPIKP